MNTMKRGLLLLLLVAAEFCSSFKIPPKTTTTTTTTKAPLQTTSTKAHLVTTRSKVSFPEQSVRKVDSTTTTKPTSASRKPTTKPLKTTTTVPSPAISFDEWASMGFGRNELHEWEARLFNHLFEERGYSNRARPAKRKAPVHVSLELVLLKINEILEIDQEIVISGFLKINWTDYRLVWRPSDFAGIDRVVTEVANIWLPDLALINSDDVYAITRDGRFPITLTSSGSMLYVPAGKINARCELNLRYFPFDSQLCQFRFESWVYNERAVKVFGQNLTIDKSHFIQNPQWAIIDTFSRTTVADYDNANFSRVEFFILLQRKSLFFLTYTVFPCGLISYLQMFSHVLPLAESERVNFGTTTLVAFAVFHISVVEQVPKSSEAIPLLAIYVDSLMCLIGLSLIESFFMLNWLSHVGFTVPSPALWYFIVEILGKYLFLGQAAVHWRKHYLRVLAKVRARNDDIRRRESNLRHLAAFTSRKLSAADQEEYARQMSYCSHLYKGFSEHNLQALTKLMILYGDLVADLTTNSLNNTKIDPRKETIDSVPPPHPSSFKVKRSISKKRQPVSAKPSTCSNGNVQRARVRFEGEIDASTVEKNDEILNFANFAEMATATTNFELPTPNLSVPKNFYFDSGVKPTVVSCTGADLLRQQIEYQLEELHSISFMLGEIKGSMGNHSLKRECHGVWTVYITAVDRIISLFLLILCTVIPVYLFVFYPEPVSHEELRRHLEISH